MPRCTSATHPGRRADDVDARQTRADSRRRAALSRSRGVGSRSARPRTSPRCRARRRRLAFQVVVRAVAGVDQSLTRRAVDHDDAGDAERDGPHASPRSNRSFDRMRDDIELRLRVSVTDGLQELVRRRSARPTTTAAAAPPDRRASRGRSRSDDPIAVQRAPRRHPRFVCDIDGDRVRADALHDRGVLGSTGDGRGVDDHVDGP